MQWENGWSGHHTGGRLFCWLRASPRAEDNYLIVADDAALSQHQVQTSRSLGHRHLSRYGVSYEPDIYVCQLDRTSCFAVCLLTDGITDGLSKSAILDVLASCEHPSDAAGQLTRDAHAASVALTGNSDDCTAVVLCL